MARSIWSGAISFGMVNIPIKVFTAISTKDVHFHQVHDVDGVRIQYKRICPADGKEVPYEHIAKGYEIAPDQYVIIKKEELEAIDPKKTHTIEIESFAELDEIDPLYFENSYYLVPDKNASKAYSLLLKAMTSTMRVAIAKTVIRTKQNVVLLRPVGNALTMSTLYYHDEVIAQKELDGLPGDVALNEKETAMAKQLIESLTTKFDVSKYRDEYREKLMAMIEKKSAGQEIITQPAMEERPKVVNLMAALEASLAAARKGAASTTSSAPKSRKPVRKAAAQGHRKQKTA